MQNLLQVLLIEDSENDAFLILRELKKGGFDVESERVETAPAMKAALSRTAWDIVIADYDLPEFNAPAALKILQEHDCDIPFIIVSGTVGEDVAVSAMKAGAHDFFAKDRLTRLIPAVERELRDAADRRARKIAEQQLMIRTHYERLLRDVAVQANIAYSVEDALQFTLDAICAYTPFEVGHVFVAASERNQDFVSSRLWHLDDDNRFSEFRTITEQSDSSKLGLIRDVIASDRPRWIRDLSDMANFVRGQQLARNEFRSCVMFPGLVDRDVIAIFEFFATEVLEPDQAFLDITVQIAYQLSRVMEREQHLRALRASEERFRKLFEAVPIPLLVTREDDGLILDTNSVFVPMIDDNVELLVGSTARSLLHDKQDWHNIQRELGVRGELHEYEVAVRRADGSHGWVLLSAQNIEYHGEAARLSGFVDISDRKRAEEAERQQRALAESLRDTAAVLLHSTLNIESVLDQIFAQIQQAIPHNAAMILLFDENEDLRVVHARRNGDLAFPPEIEGLTVDWDIFNLRSMKTKGVPYIISNNTESIAIWQKLFGIDWTQSNVGAPLRTANDTIGFITLDSSQQGAFGDDQAQFLQAFANLAATAIQNARLYEELNRYANLLEKRVADRTQKLLEAKDYVETILNSTSDPLVQIDINGKIYQTNPAFDTTFRVNSVDLYGTSVFDIVAADDNQRFQQSIQEVTQTGNATHIEVLANRFDGNNFTAYVGIASIKAEQHEIMRCICSFHDTSHQKRIEEQLRLAAREERNLRELKSRFISMATHEFRTPLTIMGMYSNLIRQQINNEQIGGYVDNIQEQLLFMENLMNEVLAFERAEAGVSHHDDEPFNLDQFLSQMVNDLQQSNLSGHRILYAVNGDNPIIAMDKKIMRQVVNNLIGNAIKYSPESDRVYVDLSTKSDEIVLCVRDMGIGIPKPDLERLFEPFHRANNVGDISGTGLGLTVIKRHIDLYGGTITVDSIPNEGTTVTISLPRHQVET